MLSTISEPTDWTTLVELLRWRAQAQPDQLAYTMLLDGVEHEQQLTYGALDRRAQAIAGLLLAQGAAGARALLVYQPGLDYIAAFFGCLYAGVTAVPVYPPRQNRSLLRLQAIAADAQASFVLTSADLLALIQTQPSAAASLGALRWLTTDQLDLASVAPALPAIEPEMLAFVQYTSGSTSTPKGVLLTHRNLLDNLERIQRYFGHSSQSCGVIWLPPYHDMGLIGGILQPLYVGFPVVLMAPVAFLQRPLRWLQAITRYRATTSGGPNFAYDLCVQRITSEQRAQLDLSSWQIAFNGAEPVRAETLRRFAQTFAACGLRPEALYPCYGLAEATLIVTGGEVGRGPVLQTVDPQALAQNQLVPADAGRTLVSAGLVRPESELLIVDPATRLVAVPGQIGEIWVGGASVAQGYWNRPQETAQTFGATLAGGDDRRFLRTGDLGCVAGGQLFVTGRLKDLLIIRGRNHYPHDIELTVEQAWPGLRPGGGAAVAIADDDQERLVVVQEVERRAQRDDPDAITAAIRAAVAAEHELHVHAVALIRQGSLPKTSSGKVQRHAVGEAFLRGQLALIALDQTQERQATPAPDALDRAALLAAAPADRAQLLERWLIMQLAHRLAVAPEQIDPQQSLYGLGLDSLITIELHQLLETGLALSLPLTLLLDAADLRQLAAAILAQLEQPSTAARAAIVPQPAAHSDPLSYGQRALWFLHQLAPMSSAYHIARALRITAPLDMDALQQAFVQLVERHPALRTRFSTSQGVPVQQVLPAARLDLRLEDASASSAAELQQQLDAAAHAPFDLADGGLLRVRVFRRSDREHVLLLVFHHIIADLWSLGLIAHEFGLLYSALRNGQPADLPPLPLHYGDYARWQQQLLEGPEGARLWRYWQQQLRPDSAGELPLLSLPTDRPRPPVQTYAGAQQTLRLSRQLTDQLKALSRAQGATLYTTLLTAYQTLLYRYSGQRDILIGTPTAGRSAPQLASLVGYFVNPVVLRAQIDGRRPFSALLADSRATVRDALAHAEFPLALLAERLQPVRDPSRSPLFQTMFVLQHLPLGADPGLAALTVEATAQITLGELTLEGWALEHRATQFDLTLALAEVGHELHAAIEYNTDLFDATTIVRMLGHFAQLLRSIVAQPELPIQHLPLLTPAERAQLTQWNSSAAPPPPPLALHQAVELQAARHPDLPALVDGAATLSYRELDQRANQLARHLQQLGVTAGARVGLCLARSLEQVVGVLGILKAGAAYVPLDPAYPPARLQLMLQDARLAALLTSEDQRWLAADSAATVCLDRDWPLIARQPSEPLQLPISPELPAYVIYTSGSTGTPKGVCCTHQGVINLLEDFQRRQPIQPGDRCSLWTSISFDVSVYELFSALTAGGTLLIVPETIRADGPACVRWLQAQQLTSVYLPPTMVQNLAGWLEQHEQPLALRRLLVGVEPLPLALLAGIQARIQGVQVFNGYGPTEASICVTLYPVEDADTSSQGSAPIGWPIQHVLTHLLDAAGQPVPVGVAGELYIGGVALAQGYLDRPALTAERFLPDPFAGSAPGRTGARMYRTGDLARYRPDGAIEFLGRIDEQIKLRGFRIELGEIEAILRRHTSVVDCVVIAVEQPDRAAQLVAYVVLAQRSAEQQAAEPSTDGATSSALRAPSELRGFLQQQLPDYMVPAAFVALPALPLTANGKIDRRALPLPDWTRSALDTPLVAPRTPLEQRLATIWQELLGHAQIGIHDNFFALGGHSLLAPQIIARCQEDFAVELPLRTIFERQTIAELAEYLQQRTPSATAAGPSLLALAQRRPAEPIYPLSYGQQSLWFLHQLAPASSAYHIPGALRISDELDVALLRQALALLVERHPALRTRFIERDGAPVQQILSAAALDFTAIDARGWSDAEVAQQLDAATHAPFDLTSARLLRVLLISRAADEHVLLLVFHHIIADLWSLTIVAREFGQLYAALRNGQPADLPPLPLHYGDYARWQRQLLEGPEGARLWDYWRTQLLPDSTGELPLLNLPTDRPRPPVQTFAGATSTAVLDAELTARIKQLSYDQGATLYITLLAAYQVLLQRYTGQSDILVGSATTGRNALELADLVGYFVNPVVLRADLRGNPPFTAFLAQMRRTVLDALAHAEFPLALLTQRLVPLRDPARSPLFETMFALQRAPGRDEQGIAALGTTRTAQLTLGGLHMQTIDAQHRTAQFDLTLALAEVGHELHAAIEYNTDLFDAATITRMFGHFEQLLRSIVAQPDLPIQHLPLLTPAERAQILLGWNSTAAPFDSAVCLHQLFESQVARTPDAPAIVFEQQQINYAELNARANQLAHQLQRCGVRPEQHVGLLMERSIELCVGLLAILKAGAAYVPFDPSSPPERLAFMLEDAQVDVLVTQQHVCAGLPARPMQIVCIDADWPTIARQPCHAPGSAVLPDNVAYVIYTSGSTGKPKGVLSTHRSVANAVRSEAAVLGVGGESRILQYATYTFDVSVLETFLALFYGGTLVMAPLPTLLDPQQLGRLLDEQAITLVTMTPSALALLPPDAGHALRCITTGGETCSPRLAAQWTRRVEMYTCWGATEATIDSTLGRLRPEQVYATLPAGRALHNTQLYVLNPAFEPVPVGVPGEAYIAGTGLARGYLNRPALTAERFIPNPFAEPGARMYRTGDLVRYLVDGTIEFVGRIDQQVKLRGFRVELGEIEAVLAQYPGLAEVVVVVREDVPGDKRLVAYIVGKEPRTKNQEPNGAHAESGSQFLALGSELRAFLKTKLPDYMVPAAFVALPALPLTPNGKVDHRALPTPLAAGETEGQSAPRTPVEALLAAIWAEVLATPQVGIHENFFELGGHSLLATQAISRIREQFQIELPLSALFEEPTVAGLAERVQAQQHERQTRLAPPIQPLPRDGTPLPLSFAQERLWFLEQMGLEQPAYNVPIAIRLRGPLDLLALRRSFDALVRRHEVLRTSFVAGVGQPHQLIAPAATVALPLHSLEQLAEHERSATIERLKLEEARRPFDLTTGPLLRLTLLRCAADLHILLLTMHHIVSDGWSIGVLARELGALYSDFSTGRDPAQGLAGSPLPVQYADFAAWQRAWMQGDVLAQQLDYWQRQLGPQSGRPLPVLQLPTDRPRPAVQSYRGAKHDIRISSAQTEQLRELSRRQSVTLFMTLLAAFDVLLLRTTGQSDLLIGTPIANRTTPQIEGLIGFFVNTLVLRVNGEPELPFSELLRRVRTLTLDAYMHQDLPFEKLVETLRLERDLSRAPLFQVMFALQNAPMPRLELGPLQLEVLGVESGTAKVDLTLDLTETPDGLEGWFEYSTDLFDAATIARMAEHFETLLAAIVADPDERVDRLPLLGPAERRLLLDDWNATAVPYPHDRTIDQLFAEQVDRAPQAIALIDGAQQLSYGELDQRANQLAHELRRLGVRADANVGICMTRSIEMVVAVVAIVKAGGSYVPLDPTYPAERLRLMLEDSRPAVVLTQPHLHTVLPPHSARVLDLISDWPLVAQQPTTRLCNTALPDNLVHVMYTSGSTGQPKGVCISHRNVARLHRGTTFMSVTPADRMLMSAPLAFDASNTEIWGALLNGAQLVIAPPHPLSLDELSGLIRDYRITVQWLTANLFHQLVDQYLDRLGSVTQLLAGGDVLSPAHVRRVLRQPDAPRLVNGYGPTENTTFTSCYALTDPAQVGTNVSIGTPIANTQVYILDRQLQPVPIGVIGELYTGGDGLARGYLNRPALTASTFLPNPFAEPGARMYRTGDLARYRPDGLIEFLGRVDHQLKLRGYRIEMGEIEAALEQHPLVQDCVVMARDRGAEKILVGYVVPRDGAALTPGELRQFLQRRLPDYMLPALFMLLERMPMSANGKVERKLLPAPDTARPELETAFVGPRTHREELLAGIFQATLSLERVGIHDSFFELGGHSLLATQLIARVRQVFQLDLPLRALFEAATIAQLAEWIAEAQAAPQQATPPLVAVPRDQPPPLSFAQQRLWFLDQLEPANPFYNIPVAIRVRGPLRLDLLEQTLNEIVRRHEVLRTTVALVERQPRQQIAAQLRLSIPVVDLAQIAPEQRAAHADQLARAEARQPFDLSRGPLIRACVLRLDPDEQIVLFTMHHIIADAWSVSILTWEVSALYTALLAGQPSPLLELPVQYADFAIWQRAWLAEGVPGGALEQQLAYWRRQLGSEGTSAPPLLRLPTDHPRPEVQTFEGAELRFELPAALVTQIRALSRRQNVTIFMILLAALKTLLYRYTGQDDLVVGTPIANRNRLEVEGLIGFFANMLVLRSDLSGNPSFAELLERVRDVTLGAYAHQDVPFERLVEELQPRRDPGYSPLFQVVCALDNVPRQQLTLPDLMTEQIGLDSGRAMFDLVVSFVDSGQQLSSLVLYNTALFEQASVEQIMAHLVAVLELVSDDPTVRLLELPLHQAAPTGQAAPADYQALDEAEQFEF